MRPSIYAFALSVVAAGCAADPTTPPITDALRVAVAPLSLPGLSEVCYDLRVTNAADGGGEIVWAQGTPGLNGGAPDDEAICSTRFGSGPGGDVTYIGPCDADGQEDADPAGERTNSVTIWFDGLYDEDGAYLPPDAAQGWQNPCVDAAGAEVGCTLNVLCEENADALVQFDFTIMRDANQGFFDVAVNFEDIFCSAKVDCAYPATQTSPARPIELVFDPNTNERVQTVMWAFACTDGDPGGASESATHLYMDDLVLDCVDAQGAHTLYTIPASAGPGNLYSLTDPAPAPLVQAMVFEGRESLQNAGADADKLYWNVALGLNMAFFAPATGTAPTCTLITKATASNGPFTDGTTPPNASYPYVTVNVPLNAGNIVTCTQHPLNGATPYDGVATTYTAVAPSGSGFTSTTFSNAAAVINGAFLSAPTLPDATNPCDPNPCLHGACTVSGDTFTCTCEPGWTGPLCTLDLDGCEGVTCSSGKGCQDTPAPGTGYTCVACTPEYVGVGRYCQPRNVPLDDPYLAYTHTEDWNLYPEHELAAVADTNRWYFPSTYDDPQVQATINTYASDRLIFRDQHTGAEVWLMARGPQDEDVVYTNERRFNADGSLIRMGSFVPLTSSKHNLLLCTDGSRPGSAECPYEEVPAISMWSASDPTRFVTDYPVETPVVARYELTVGDELPSETYTPPAWFTYPQPTANMLRDLSADLGWLGLVPRNAVGPKMIRLFADLTPSLPYPTFSETPTASYQLYSYSANPDADVVGTTEFLRDYAGRVYFRYSLNKGKDTRDVDPSPVTNPTPYQNWMFDVTDAAPNPNYIELSSQSEPLADPTLLLRSHSEVPSAGHGGVSPSRAFVALQTSSKCKRIKDFRNPLAGRTYYIDMKMPSCDHMDWTVADSFFYVWVRDNGTPIYRVETALNANDELKARNVFRVVTPQACQTNYFTDVYQNASPDGTKVLYASNMLSARACPQETDPGYNFLSKVMADTLDLYMAVVEYPKPPASLKLTPMAQGVRLEWPVSDRSKTNLPIPSGGIDRAKEIVGYHVYRSAQSGRGYVRLTATPVPQPSGGTVIWDDPTSGSTPHYVVTAVEHSGLEGRDFSPEAALSWGAQIRVFWEAEEGELGPRMREVFLPAETSNNFAIAKFTHDPNWNLALGEARATWKVHTPAAGSYRLWVRARSRTGAAVSSQVSVDGASGMTLSVDTTSWSWRQVMVAAAPTTNALALSAGPHFVSLSVTDASLEIDKLLLTTEPSPTLTGYGDTPSLTAGPIVWGASPATVLTVSGTLDYYTTKALTGTGGLAPHTGRYALLRWESAGPTTHHYQVYRGTSAAPQPTQAYLVGSPSKPSFVDPNLPAGTYHYVVQAVDAWGQASAPSTSQVVVVP